MIFKGKVVDIGELTEVPYFNRPSVFKRMLLIAFQGQSIYCELRDKKLKMLQSPISILIGDEVEVEIKFKASEKQLKKYNNLIVQKIIKI